MLKSPLSPGELALMQPEDHPNNEPDAYSTALNCFTQKNTEALVKCTRIALDAVKRRLQPSNRYQSSDSSENVEKAPLFKGSFLTCILSLGIYLISMLKVHFSHTLVGIYLNSMLKVNI